MAREKGWLKGQMSTATLQVGGWHGWKKDTIREQVSSRLSTETRGKSIVLWSGSGGRTVKGPKG
jgi:hypothetical protein